MALVQFTTPNEDPTMARKTTRTVTTAAAAAAFETMEPRTMYSATPAVVGYLPDWENTPALVANLKANNWSGLTQLNYFSVTPDAAGRLPTTTSQNGQSLSELTKLADAAPASVAVNIVVGGAWTDSNGLATILGAATVNPTTGDVVPATGHYDATAAAAFGRNLATFCTAHHLDGVDLDWEPVAQTAADVGHYASLIAAVRAATPGLKLSAAVPAEADGSGYVLNATAVNSLDQINVMDYDLGKPGDGAPIAAAEADMKAWAKVAPATKLVMGLPFYGRGTTLTSAQMPDNDPWGSVTDDNTGLPSYGQLVTAAGGTVTTTGSANLTVTAKIAGVAGGHKVAYHFDGPGTIAAKTTFALDQHYAGVMAWSLGQDSFNANGSYTAMSLMPVIQKTVAARVTTPTPTPTPTPTATRLTGTSISSDRFENNGPGSHIADAGDNNLSTAFYSNFDTGWYGLDLGTAARVSQVKIAPAAGHGWNMVGGTFQASNDPTFATGSVTLADITTAPASGQLTVLTVTAAGSYRYVRYVSPAGSHGEAAEVQYFGTPAAASPAVVSADDQKKPVVFADNAAAVAAAAVVDAVR